MKSILVIIIFIYLFISNIVFGAVQKQNTNPHNELETDTTSFTNDSNLETLCSFGLYSSVFYLIPQKSSFQENYENRFPIFNLEFPPVGLEFGMVHYLTHSIELLIDIGTRNHVLKEDLGTSIISSLHVYPVSIFGRYVWRFNSGENPYLGFGVAGYWARFASEIVNTDTSPDQLGTIKVTQNYFGIGLLGEIGFLYKIRSNNYLDLGIRYDFTRVGNPQTGGLGNIGGVRFHFRGITFF